MNLFILSLDPKECAEMMMDVHIVKIILEAVQMLSTAKRLLSVCRPECAGSLVGLKPAEKRAILLQANALELPVYRVAHASHPVCIWVRQSRANFMWTLDLVDAMHNEWRYRYNHPDTVQHKSYVVAQYLRANVPESFPDTVLTPFAVAMPEECKVPFDVIGSYRLYYKSNKRSFATWKKRAPPDWFHS